MKNPYTVFVGVVVLAVLGFISFGSMPTDLLPSMDLPYVMAFTSYEGASPEEVEMVVSKPLESSLATVAGIKNITSVSRENSSQVVLEFNDDVNMDSTMLDINAKLDLVEPYWPDAVGTPILLKLNPDMLPIMVASLDKSNMDIRALSKHVDETLLPELEAIEGVASVDVSGLIVERVDVTIQQSKIDELNHIVLLEVDKELAKVEDQLNDGQAQLDQARQQLESQARNGLAQIDSMIRQLEQGKKNLPETIAQLQAKKAEMQQQLEQTKAGILQLHQQLNQLPDAPLTSEEAKRLDALNAEIENLNNRAAGLRSELNEVIEALRRIEQNRPTPEPTIDPNASPEPSITPAPTKAPAKERNRQKTQGSSSSNFTGGQSTGGGGGAKKEPEEIASNLLSPLFWQNARAEGEDEERLLLRRQELETQLQQIEQELRSIHYGSEYLGLNQKHELSDTIKTLREQLSQAEAAVPQLEGGLTQMDDMIAKLQSGILPAGLIEGMNQDIEIDAALSELQKQRDLAVNAIDKGKTEIEKAQNKLGEARKEFEDQREDAFEEAKLDGVITIPMISQILAAQNFQMPAGYLKEDGQEYLVRLGDKFTDTESMGDMLLFTMDLKTLKEVRLMDVADVLLADNTNEIYTKVNGNDGIILTFQKQSTFSSTEVSQAIKDRFDALTTADSELRITPLMDQGIYINMIIESVLGNLWQGALLAVLILLIFLADFRPTIIVAVSIPVSVVAAFVTMYFTGITLNTISLAGLALGVGMLVDNSIVVIDNIYRLHEEERMPLLRACVQGAGQMSGAIFSSTLTTVCVFVPIVFVQGIARDLFEDMGLTILYSLMASLLVALTVVPAMSGAMLKRTKPKKHRVFGAIQRVYVALLRGALRAKWLVLGFSLALLIYSVMQISSMGTQFMPEVDSQQMTASLTVPDDYNFDQTNMLAGQVLEKLTSVQDVETVGVFNSQSGGTRILSAGSGLGGGSSASSLTFYMSLAKDKTLKNTEIASLASEAIAPLGVDMSFASNSMDISMLSGDGISVEVRGPDIDTLRKITTELADIMRSVPGTIDVSDGQEKSVPEIKLTVDKEAARREGLTSAQIYQFLAGVLNDGVNVTEVTMDGQDYDVVLIQGKYENLTRQELSNLNIDATKGNESNKIRLGDICDITETLSLEAINRKAQQRILTARCDIAQGYNIGLVGEELNTRLASYQPPDGYQINITGENEMINSTLNDLMNMVGLAIILIYLIMVAQFQSFRSPFIVMFTIPLAFTGGLLLLIFLNMQISMVAMLGFLVLAGVIVNNGIVFVDSINQMRLYEGMSKRQAMLETGRVRLRPILMTALTTILGMSTMALGSGMGAEMMQPMAIVTIGGLTYATFMTLFVVPILYDMFGPRRMRNRMKEIADEVDALPS